MAPICGMCGFALTKVKSGVVVGELLRDKPKLFYRLWMADRFECQTPNCDFTGFIITDFGQRPFAEQHQPDFLKRLEEHPPEIFWHERSGQ